LAGENAEDVNTFVAGFKSFIQVSHQFSRLCITGSGMLTMMQCIRMQPLNSFVMIDVARVVATGDSPDIGDAHAIANLIVSSYARFWPHAVRDFVTPQKMVETVQANQEVMNFRPAIFSFLCACMGDASTGTPEEILKAAVNCVDLKIFRESEGDLRRVLQMWYQDADFRSALFKLAAGDAEPLNSHPMGSQPILNSLRTTGRFRPFFPPYNRLLTDSLLIDGRPEFPKYVPPVLYNEGLIGQMIFYFEEYDGLSGTATLPASYPVNVTSAVSEAVFGFLLCRGIGKVLHSIQNQLVVQSIQLIQTAQDILQCRRWLLCCTTKAIHITVERSSSTWTELQASLGFQTAFLEYQS
jgi:hypothetical protein